MASAFFYSKHGRTSAKAALFPFPLIGIEMSDKASGSGCQ